MKIEYGETDYKPQLGDIITLKNQEQEVVECEETEVLMLNIDANQLAPGDLKFIKQLGLTISNPETDRPVALGVDYVEDSWGSRISDYLTKKEKEEDEDDDSSFFSSAGSLLGSSWSGGSTSSGGGFGGFGGGGFSGGGASSSF